MLNAELTDEIQFFKTLSFRKVYNGFLLRCSYLLSKIFNTYIHWGQPEFLSIEPTNLCNLSCPECASGTNNLGRQRQFLSSFHYKSTIDKVAKHLSYLQLFLQGEPLMHPKIYEFIEYATSKRIYSSISTNGQFLSENNCRKLVNSGLHRLIVSIDGATQGVYEKYRVGGSLNKAIQGIRDLIAIKTKSSSKTPYIIIQFVVFKHNEHQIPEIKNMANELGVSLQLKTAQLNDFELNNSELPVYSRYKQQLNGKYQLNRPKNYKCKRIWYGSVVTANNSLLPCCFDKQAIHPYSKMDEGYFAEEWKNKKAINFRKRVWNYDPEIKICSNCTEGLKHIIKKA